MNDTICAEAVDAIVANIVETLPNSLLEFYRNPPGRKPSQQTLKVSEIVKKLDDDEALALIRSVMDGSLFAVLSLFDMNFKDKNIEVHFRRSTGLETALLHELYRLHVDPGGQIALG